MSFFPTNVDLLGRALMAAGLRQQVLANNIANADTPGFKAQAVKFEEFLQQAQGETGSSGASLEGLRSDPRHFYIGATRVGDVAPQVVAEENGPMRPDGNNVDMEGQMAQLATNQLWYQALVRSESDTFARLNTVITGGGR